MPELQNEFSWSKSRHEKFEECRRAYYYQYYGSWGGWEADPGSLTRELYVLKKLSSRWQWAGSVVHEAIRQLLMHARISREFLPLEEILRQMLTRARAQWASSREKSYWREASRITGLVEHEYGEPVTDGEWKRIWNDVIEGSLRVFYSSQAFEGLRRVPIQRWLTVDELDSWIFEGVKVWVAIDFAYRDSDERIHLLDWKTGREREVDHTQVGIYALYARQKWGVSEDAVVGGLVYLGSNHGDRVDVQANDRALAGCQEQMRQSIAAMRAVLDDPARNRASVERFPQLADPDGCRRCPFRRPCGRM